MSELKKINEKLFYLFAGGLIIDILAKESLKNAFLFSVILGSILFISFLIYKLADYYDWINSIKEWIEEIIEIAEDFFDDAIEWIKEVFGR